MRVNRAGLNGPSERQRLPAGRDRALANELFRGVCRWRNLLDYYLQQFCRSPLSKLPPVVLNILRLGAYQLVFLQRIPDYAAIDQAVLMTRAHKFAGLSGFVNGTLRTIARNKPNLTPPQSRGETVDEIATLYSHPVWLVERWIKRFGAANTRDICVFNNQESALSLRCRPNEREVVMEELAAIGFLPQVDEEISSAVHLVQASGLFETALFNGGKIYPQDASSQLIAPLVCSAQCRCPLDAACGPGGKTLHIIDLIGEGVPVVAADVQPHELRRLHENAVRWGVRNSIYPVLVDLSRHPPFSPRMFDAILLDAPCSGLGMIGRHPESKWNRTEELVALMAKKQRHLLGVVSELLAPGGRLVYSTCSFELDETEENIRWFLAENSAFQRVPVDSIVQGRLLSYVSPDSDLLVLPHLHQRSGYYAALLERRKGC